MISSQGIYLEGNTPFKKFKFKNQASLSLIYITKSSLFQAPTWWWKVV